ncbi:MAG: pyridoxal phosphate-dependent aminotransferase [Gammaproteobacteria bacterium]|nr:pyridoxal phosphate-dependent aminotransferase [Gammaproteobacteria bacterium]
MNLELSSRVNKVRPSATLAVTARASELRAQGHNIIGLGAGEPDFDTPLHIKKAAIAAINAGMTKYTAVDGTAELKQAIINKFQHDNQLHYQKEQILVSSGGKQSFFNLAQALLNTGDEVIIPAPYWVSYPDMVLLADGTPVIIKTSIDQHFKITAQQLADNITAKTRLLVINSPTNPTGAAYSADELSALAAVLIQHPHVLIATDDMYEHIRWDNTPFINILNTTPELYERTLVLNGVSKAYAMTGWRIGYAGGPKDLIKAMKKIQSQSTSNPCSISQAAAVAALTGEQSCITTMVKAFKERHDYVVQKLNSISGIQCIPSNGAFYAFPQMSALIEQVEGVNNDVELASRLLDESGVALVPGSAFGAPGYMRLSFATSMENLTVALDRIEAFAKQQV